MNIDHPHYRVHITHCCTRYCKYGDGDCPVVAGVEPAYKCEDCTCAIMNPEQQQAADEWVNSLTPSMRLELYLSFKREL